MLDGQSAQRAHAAIQEATETSEGAILLSSAERYARSLF
jgi:hypothetical protein